MAGWIVRVVLAAGLSVAAASIVPPGIVTVLLALVVVAVVLELARELRGRRRRYFIAVVLVAKGALAVGGCLYSAGASGDFPAVYK